MPSLSAYEWAAWALYAWDVVLSFAVAGLGLLFLSGVYDRLKRRHPCDWWGE